MLFLIFYFHIIFIDDHVLDWYCILNVSSSENKDIIIIIIIIIIIKPEMQAHNASL